MAAPTSTFWASNKNTTVVTGANIANTGINAVYATPSTSGGTTINAGPYFTDTATTATVSIRDPATGEQYDVLEELRNTRLMLSAMTSVLDNIIKDNPDIIHAKSIGELVDQQKMMNKLIK